LLPEIVEEMGLTFSVSALLLTGIILFFVIEKIIHWHYNLASYEKEHAHPLAIMILAGGAVHNLLDGLVIGASFLVNIPTGIAITTAIALHKVPKEMGWFGVLVHGGFSKFKAITFNYLSSVFTIVGAVIALLVSSYVENIQFFIIPVAVGGFIYLAGSDLIPELHKEVGLRKALLQLIAMLAGIAVMALLLLL
jgi:zinc and cadmium transporter